MWDILQPRLRSDPTVVKCAAVTKSSPAEHLALCKPLSALTSCLTPPHPVDSSFFFCFFSPLPSTTWQQMRHPWRRMTRQQPSPTYSELLSICSLGKTDEPRWREEKRKKKKRKTSVRTVSVSDNCLGQQNGAGMNVSAKAGVGVTARAVCYFQGYDISHCTCTRR